MQKPVIISNSLKFLFESIELVLEVKTKESILSKILSESEQDQVNEKSYRLNSEKDKVKVNALVEGYEPGTIWLMFENINNKQKTIELEELFDNYDFAFGLGASYRSLEESVAIYQKGAQKKI